MEARTGIGRLVFVPALVTLLVTLLRLTGELLDWSPLLFSRAVGGGAALVGIIWLVPVFGVYFARRLARDGRSGSSGRTVGYALLGAGVFAVLAAAGFAQPTASPQQFLLIACGALGGIALAHRGWPRLSLALLAYGLASRIPVAVVILMAILGGWNTHYDTPPPGLPEMGPLARWLAIGLVPQLTIWMAVTSIVGALAGGLSLAVVRPRAAAAATGSP